MIELQSNRSVSWINFSVSSRICQFINLISGNYAQIELRMFLFTQASFIDLLAFFLLFTAVWFS